MAQHHVRSVTPYHNILLTLILVVMKAILPSQRLPELTLQIWQLESSWFQNGSQFAQSSHPSTLQFRFIGITNFQFVFVFYNISQSLPVIITPDILVLSIYTQ